MTTPLASADDIRDASGYMQMLVCKEVANGRGERLEALAQHLEKINGEDVQDGVAVLKLLLAGIAHEDTRTSRGIQAVIDVMQPLITSTQTQGD